MRGGMFGAARFAGVVVLVFGGLAAVWVGAGDHQLRSVVAGRAPFDWAAACAIGFAAVLVGGGLLLADRSVRRRRPIASPPKRVFAALERAEPALLARLGPHGIIGVEYVVGFVHPYVVWVWLVTTSDAERDALGELPFLDEVREVLTEVGLPDEDADFEGTTVQSQETVDRDYDGSWFYALR